MQLIGLTTSGQRFINYDSYNLNLPNNTELVTIKELPPEVLEAIQEASFERVQEILNNYI